MSLVVPYLTPAFQAVSNKAMLADTMSSHTVRVKVTMLAFLCLNE